MLKLFTLKDQSQQQQNSTGHGTKKVTAAQLRITKDINELDVPKTMKVEFPDPDDLQNMTLTISPDEGLYKGGKFTFSIKVSNAYPHEPPKVKCLPKVYHPNIDYEGNVCLNILREEWKPVLTISSVVFGLMYLFLEPNADDPLNKEAADLMVRNRSQFISQVTESMKGKQFGGHKFDRVIPN